MRVVRLEIFGFKSFVDRFVLNFDEDMLGVVGPNGCGKSNIVDALRWVLGETHARQLRGTVLHDLIFNGCESRRPLGMAEVSITLRPEQGWTRTIDEQSRAIEEAREATLDLEGSETGQAAELEAESKREEQDGAVIPSSLLDIPGVFNAAEIQLTRRLYRSGESEFYINRVACRLKDMTELYRLIGLGSRGLSIVEQGEIGEFISKKPVQRRELLEEAAGISGFRTRIEAAQRRLDRTRDNMARLTDIITEVDKQVRVLKRQAKRARERSELKAGIRRTEDELFTARAARILTHKRDHDAVNANLGELISEKDNKLLLLEALQQESSAKLEELELKLSEKRRSRDDLAESLHEHREREQELKLELARLETNLEALAANDERLGNELNALSAQLNKQSFGSESCSQQSQKLQQTLADAEQQLQTHAELLSEERVKSARLEAEQAALERQLQGLSEHIDRPTTEEEGSAEDGDTEIPEESAKARSLAEALNVDQPAQRAVRAVLGERAGYAVSSAAFEFAKTYEARGNEAEKKRLGYIDQRFSPDSAEQRVSVEERQQAPSARLLSECVETSEDDGPMVEALFSSAVLVDTLGEALALRDLYDSWRNQQNPQPASRRLVVTKDGEIVAPWGWYTTEDSETELSLKTRIDECFAEWRKLQSEIEHFEQGFDVSQRRVSELRTELGQTLARNEAERMQSEGLNSRKARLEQERNELQIQKAALDERRQGLLRNLDIESEQDTDERRERQSRVLGQLGSLTTAIREFEDERESVRKALAEVSQGVSEVRTEVSDLKDKLSGAKLEIERCNIELSVISEDVRRLYGEEWTPPSEAEAVEVVQKVGVEIDAHIARLEEQSQQLRRRLEREGEVDEESIERYETEQKRLSEMKQQIEDLEAAAKILERTIRHLKEISRTRFIETFAFVKEKFAELVPRLFGGGAGHLSLINPEDPLTSGVELSVRPPGKRLSNMELLSGGEKALVATAVLMAMFLHRPSPICVLDEVDAPLDDANLERFLGLIQEIAEQTQFLIITHNKQTMGSVDRLIGITMEEKGVSKALSVNLDRAEAELERWAANA